MSTLTVPRSLTDNTNPTEAQFDTMRTYLLGFFNSTNLDETNVSAGSMLWTTVGPLADDATFKFTGSVATMSFISASDYFKIINTGGDIVWGHRSGATLTDYMELDSTTGDLTLKGQLYFNSSVGSQEVSLLWLLANYRKPRLDYTSADVVTAEDNAIGTSFVMMRDRLCYIYDTSMSLAATANGYETGHTLTAVSGLRVSETRTANRWYYIYAVRVVGGSQANGTYCILVATTVSPVTSNITTLNGYFTAGEWVYMGCIRNGYNDGTNTNVIVKFKHDGGMMRFTEGTVADEGKGVTLASQTGIADLEYTTSIANAAASDLPEVATRVVFGGHRSVNGMEMHYRAVATNENHMIVSGCMHQDPLTTTVAVEMEVPLLASYKVVIQYGDADSADARITLTGYSDHYV